MANEWIQSNGAACYNTATQGFALSETLLTVGKAYVVNFTVLERTLGKLLIDGIGSREEVIENGDYTIIGVATSTKLSFVGAALSGGVFNGCIDNVETRLIPFITIKDTDGNIVFQQVDETGVTAHGDNIQYQIDWTDQEEGCYQLYFSAGIDYVSDCISLNLSHGCTILLSWTNDDNAYGFNYEDLNFEPQLRVKAKLWKPNYPKEKNVFKDNAGNRTVLKSETSKEEILTVSDAPEYIHDALAIGLEHDYFYADGVKYANEETEYTPKWRKSSQLAPSEAVIIKDQLLRNNNC